MPALYLGVFVQGAHDVGETLEAGECEEGLGDLLLAVPMFG